MPPETKLKRSERMIKAIVWLRREVAVREGELKGLRKVAERVARQDWDGAMARLGSLRKHMARPTYRRPWYTPEFRSMALELANRVGLGQATRALGLAKNTIRQWRKLPPERIAHPSKSGKRPPWAYYPQGTPRGIMESHCVPDEALETQPTTEETGIVSAAIGTTQKGPGLVSRILEGLEWED